MTIRLCLMLLHSIWQFALLALVVVIIQRLWRTQSSQHSYLTSVFAMLVGLILLPFTYQSISPATTTAGGTTPAAEMNMDPPATLTSTPAISLPNLTNAAADPVDLGAAEQTGWLTFTPWLVGLYALGVAGMLLRLVIATCRAHRLGMRAAVVDSGPLHEFLHLLAQRWSMQMIPKLAIAEQIVIPKVVGIAKPTILLPAAALTGLSRQELEMIVAHELAHVRRHDVWVHLTQRLAEAVLFFNPALWYLSRRISLLREYCCDELACGVPQQGSTAQTSQTSPAPQIAYAMALLRVVELTQTQRSTMEFGSLAASGRSPSELRRRIAKLLGEPLREPIRITRGGVLTMLVGGVLLASPMIWKSHAEPQQPDAVDTQVAERAVPDPDDDDAAGNDAPAEISGQIVLENGDPATTTGWMYYQSTFANGNGAQGTDNQYTDHFSSKVPAGKTWLSYFPEGFAPLSAGPFQLQAGERQDNVTLTLKTGFSSLLQVRNEQGAAIAGATVIVHPVFHGQAEGPNIPQTTDQQGELRLEHLAATRYVLRITAAGYQPLRSEPLDVAPNKTLVQTLMRAPATQGVVLTADGTPAVDAKLRMVYEQQPNGSGISYPGGPGGFWGKVITKTDSQGRFTLDQLTPKSEYLFVVEAQDGARAAVHDLVAGRQNVRITLPPRRDLIVSIKGDIRKLPQRRGKPYLNVRQRIQSNHGNLLGGTAEITVSETGGTAVFRGLITDLNPDVTSQNISVRLPGVGNLVRTVKMDLQNDTLVEFEIPEGDAEDMQASINESDRYRLTRLARAAEQGQAAEVRALLDAGADINQAVDGYTALMRACIGKQPKTAKILLEAGADPNRQRHDGQSALHFAAKNGSVECTKLLLRHNADDKAQTAYKNWTPRDWAQHYKHQAVVDLLDQ